MNAFVDNPLPGGALEYYGNLANPLQAAKTAIFVLLTLVGDAFVVCCVFSEFRIKLDFNLAYRSIVATLSGVDNGGSLFSLFCAGVEPEVGVMPVYPM